MSLFTELYIELIATLFYSRSEKPAEEPLPDNVIYVDFQNKKRKAA